MKSLQFRSIAPKAPATVVPTPAVLSCQPPSALPEASLAVSPKSIIVPTQNYALMQVAGQEGTFSLVALTPSVSPQSSQQPIQKNLKLPIPRYQPMRSKSAPEKAMPTSTVARGANPAKVAVKKGPSEPTGSAIKVEPTEQVILLDSASSELAVTALLPDNAVLYSGAQEQGTDPVDRPASGLLQNLHYPSGAVQGSPVKLQEDGGPVASCQSKSASQSTGSITVLSPAIFGKAVQFIPSPPKGKLPILPYSKMKSTLMPVAKLKSPGKGVRCQPGAANPSDPTSNTPEIARVLCQNQTPNRTPQGQPQATVSAKPPGKKRGRKRKTMEDILAFEARKKRSLSFFRRRVPEKPPATATEAKDKVVDISKKYRSIRPKPILVMETVPQLMGLPPLSLSEALEQDLLVGQPLPAKAPGDTQLPSPGPLRTISHRALPGAHAVGRPLHRCPTCSRCFVFKHHLQSHLTSHTNSRPYACPVCRKAYAHSGSLSTHMKLHHSEGRPRRTLRCEFCEKAFGYVGVYFSHLREVHRVVLTVEPSISQHEDDVPVEGAATSADPVDEQGQEREDPVELQIKCGRCQAITPTFADMKLHLLYVHGEEVHLRDGAPRGGREAEDELVKHAAHYWRQLNEKRNLVKCGSCDEEFFSFSKLKRHIHSHHQGETEDGTVEDRERKATPLWTGSAFNCVLCSQTMDRREEVLEHWEGHHHCEDPSALWEVLSSCTGNGDADAPDQSSH